LVLTRRYCETFATIYEEGVTRALSRFPAGKALLWAALAVPAGWLAIRWAGEADPWLADYVADTGLWSARFLVAALCLTPLQHLVGHRPWMAWAIRHRRAIGVAAFLYTLLHIALYAVDMGDFAAIADEAPIASMASGWLAAALMLVPALTSTDGWMRALGAGWKRVQRFAYPAAILTLVHWALVHDGFVEALLHFAPLALLQLFRLARRAWPVPQERKTI
jgi:sulfoxide reductase heme-binding subunit YedZ